MTKNEKILLVYPGMLGAFKPEIPLPLLYLSSVLRAHNIPCEIFDMRLRDYRKCNLSGVSCVGITSMTGSMIKYGLEFAQAVRSYDENIPLVWGGVHPSLLPEQTVESPLVDIVVWAEGELTFLELVGALRKKTPLDSLQGITFEKEGKSVSTPPRPFMDLNTIPLKLPYDLLEIDKYDLSNFPIHTSRGCPSQCTFCYNQSYNRGSFRFKSAERVLDEIELTLKKFPSSVVNFTWEDNFFVLKDRVEKICRGFLERRFNVEWEAFCRFDYFSRYDQDFIDLIEESGCRLISFGGESGSQEILDNVLHKGVKIEQIKEATRKMAKTGMAQVVSFMCGVPEEKPEDLERTALLIDQLVEINPRVEPNGIFFFTPYPGTRLFDKVVEEHHFPSPESLEEWQDYKIYRDVKCTWLPQDYAKMLQRVSIMSRFPFFTDDPKIPERFSKFPHRLLYRLLARLARWRWKHRFFKFPLEWLLVENIMEKSRGFV